MGSTHTHTHRPDTTRADVEFASPDVHYLSSITVSYGKVFAMFVKSPTKVGAVQGGRVGVSVGSGGARRAGSGAGAAVARCVAHPHVPPPLLPSHLPPPPQMFAEDEAALRAIRASFYTV